LPAAFERKRWTRATNEVLANAAGIVSDQLETYPALSAYQPRLQRAVQRVSFVDPLEYLIHVVYDRKPAQREQALMLLLEDPSLALGKLADDRLWPSARAELVLDSKAHFDTDDDRVLVNLGATSEHEALTVVVHELWHALPEHRYSSDSEGRTVLTTGFWSERWQDALGWVGDEDRHGLIFATYLLDEAMAYRLEWRGMNKEPQTHDDVRRAASFLERVESRLGAERLLTLYLLSDQSGFFQAVHEQREALPEFFATSGP
jgi:hypothetical protein